MSSGAVGSSGEWSLRRGRVAALAGLLFVDFVLVLVMLLTDKNLQTNFGAQSPYFSHWYALLAEGVLDLLVAIAVLFGATRPGKEGGSARSGRGMVLAATAWAGLAFLANIAIVFAFQQVGFASADQFAQYLFGVTAASGDIRYLYDVLLAAYALTAVVGAFAMMHVPAPPKDAAAT